MVVFTMYILKYPMSARSLGVLVFWELELTWVDVMLS